MFKKIIWILILCILTYLILIFNFPIFAGALENALWIKWFNHFILSFKYDYDESKTNIPSQNELKVAYDDVYSWAIDFREKFVDGLYITKSKIDNVRETLNNTKEKYDDVKEWYDDVKQTIDTIVEISNKLTNTWVTY